MILFEEYEYILHLKLSFTLASFQRKIFSVTYFPCNVIFLVLECISASNIVLFCPYDIKLPELQETLPIYLSYFCSLGCPNHNVIDKQ